MIGIRNFYKVSECLACAGQPSEDQLVGLVKEEYEVVINLGLLDQNYSLQNEAGIAQTLGIVYHHVPVQFEAPSLEDLREFVKLMGKYENRKVLVHCAANYRAISFVALLLFAKKMLDEIQVTSLVTEVWSPNPVWTSFIEEAMVDMSWR